MKKAKKVAIQGVKGAFHEEATHTVFGTDVEVQYCMTFEEEINALQSGAVDAAVMALENTISGTILNNFELIRNSGLKIVGEVTLKIEQHLGGIPGAQLEHLQEVRSHYMALNQCCGFFSKYPNIELVESPDTALAIKEVSEANSTSLGAIGSQLAIEYYGLNTIARNIQSNANNYTRFAVLGKALNASGNKVSLAVVLNHESGSLSRLLQLISLVEANLTKIESVPMENQPFRYRFYIDIELNTNVTFKSTIEILKPQAEELIVLGRYSSENSNS